MRRIKNGDRRMVMEHYLSLERRKRDDLPVDLPVLDFDDPNELDDWLRSHVLKVGVVSGFKRWVLVELEPQEIR